MHACQRQLLHALNAHVQCHCCIIDGVLAAAEDGQIRLAETITRAATEVAAVQHQVRSRVLRWCVRAGYLDATAALHLAAWEHGGGSGRRHERSQRRVE